MYFLPKKIDHYVVAHSQEEPQLLKQLTRETYQKVLQPIMLSGPYQGRVLSMISKLKQPKTILELGTFTGYATLCLAEGLMTNGRIDTIDINEELADFQRKYFHASDYGHQIHQHIGNALDIIPTLNNTYDLVFIDADKTNYVNYFHLIIDKVSPGGIIISDNVLWHGKVVEPLKEKDESTKAVLEFNTLLKEDHRIETVVLPIRDGLTISRKK
ncbi:O-methyltransferase [uncultured Psychroserpens sp.]|uniref:O-methyltransferase n=1 Tax=uncultured Psychroserpens sp. TaxID=255436 RepID=UPI00260A2FEE|nr:O-methyltransferase [uncultured Psychroserpens sp.]